MYLLMNLKKMNKKKILKKNVQKKNLLLNYHVLEIFCLDNKIEKTNDEVSILSENSIGNQNKEDAK